MTLFMSDLFSKVLDAISQVFVGVCAPDGIQYKLFSMLAAIIAEPRRCICAAVVGTVPYIVYFPAILAQDPAGHLTRNTLRSGLVHL